MAQLKLSQRIPELKCLWHNFSWSTSCTIWESIWKTLPYLFNFFHYSLSCDFAWFSITTSSSFFFNSFHLILISISRIFGISAGLNNAVQLFILTITPLTASYWRGLSALKSLPLNSIVVSYCPKYFSRSSTDSSVHLNLFAFSTLFFTICLLVFSQLHTFNSCVCFKIGMYVYDIRATLPFLSGFYAIAHAPTHFCPGTNQVGWPVLWKRASSAIELTRFQLSSYNRNFIIE